MYLYIYTHIYTATDCLWPLKYVHTRLDSFVPFYYEGGTYLTFESLQVSFCATRRSIAIFYVRPTERVYVLFL
jgi:hypothetical protein